MPDFVLRALLAGLSVALVAGPLGCFVVWRRMAYFGDTLAHSALLGIGLGLLGGVDMQFAVIGACVAVALLLGLMERRGNLATDTLLGILSHSTLAVGLIVVSLAEVRVDLMGYLFGDLLTVGTTDLVWIVACSAITLALLLVFWTRLLNITLHGELAQVEGLDTAKLRLALMILVALVVAVSMKIIGVLLITALLVIPPAAARGLARTPESMAILASTFGCLAVLGGMGASFWWDTPTGPSVVVCAAMIFVAVSMFSRN